MIISHKYKYLFVELPLTGSTAISAELQESYDGTEILYKHTTYQEFLRIASEDEKKYFVFSGMRNPLDQAVSHYFKFLTDHRHQFSDDQKFKRKGVNRLAYTFSHLRRYQFVSSAESDFASFFLNFYKVPYNNWSSLAHKDFDFIIRFENLSDDFATLLELLKIEAKRPLPVRNKTGARDKGFLSYYNSPEVIARAKWVFGPYMKRWGYEFPAEWGQNTITVPQQVTFHFVDIFRNVYWRYLRQPYNDHQRRLQRVE